jgi:Kdo2-lipid IVA lauroyltransferase/acyltransferase
VAGVEPVLDFFAGLLGVGALRATGWALGVMPRRLRLALGSFLGLCLRASGARAKVIRQNLAYAYPDNEARQDELFVEAYRHMGRLILEVLLLFGPMRRFARKDIEIEGVEHIVNGREAGRGVILLSSHVGNWEIMAASAVQVPGMHLMLVTKHLKPEWLHQAIERARARCGVCATYEPRTLRDVLRQLKEGQVVGFVLDQYAGPPVGLRVPVFGIPVGTTSAVAMLARRTGAAVLPVVNYRLPDGRYRAEIRAPLEWQTSEGDDLTEELGLNTAYYAATLQRDIFQHPGQWLWTHRRFKGDLSPLRPKEWSEGRARR